MKDRLEAVVVDNNNDQAQVRLERHSDCNNCGACGGQNIVLMEAENRIGARSGQHVEIELRNQNILKSAFIVFILPLSAILAGAVAGFWSYRFLHYGETLLEVTGGIIFFLLSVVYIKYIDKKITNQKNRPRIVRILH